MLSVLKRNSEFFKNNTYKIRLDSDRCHENSSKETAKKWEKKETPWIFIKIPIKNSKPALSVLNLQ